MVEIAKHFRQILSHRRQERPGEFLMISDSRRLIPPGVPRTDIAAEIKKATRTRLEGLPPRITWSKARIEAWKRAGAKLEDLPGGRDPIVYHPNLQREISEGNPRVVIDSGQDFHNVNFADSYDPRGYTREENRGLPMAPHLEELLENGFQSVNLRYYPGYGSQRAVDVVLAIPEDEEQKKWSIVGVDRRDLEKAIALPGGGVEEGETDLEAGLRELYEEALSDRGIDLRNAGKFEYRIVNRSIVPGDPRQQITAWPESCTILIVPDPETAAQIRLKTEDDYPAVAQSDKDDTRRARKVLAGAKQFKNLAFSHERFAYRAFDVLQRMNRKKGMAIDKDGREGMPVTPIAGELMIAELAQKLFMDWRESRRQANDTYEPSIKTTRDTNWIERHGTDQVDIASIANWNDLPFDQQEENMNAAFIAFCTVEHAVSRKQNLDDPSVIDRASSDIHEQWLVRNPKGKEDIIKGLPFIDISKAERGDVRLLRGLIQKARAKDGYDGQTDAQIKEMLIEKATVAAEADRRQARAAIEMYRNEFPQELAGIYAGRPWRCLRRRGNRG